jgi:hypothetical protein
MNQIKNSRNFKKNKNDRNIITGIVLDFITNMQDLFSLKRMFLDNVNLNLVKNNGDKLEIDEEFIFSGAIKQMYKDNNFGNESEYQNSIFKFVRRNTIIKNIEISTSDEMLTKVYLKSCSWIFNYLNVNLPSISNRNDFKVGVYFHNLLNEIEQDTFNMKERNDKLFQYVGEIDKIQKVNNGEITNKQVMEVYTIVEHLKLVRFFSKYRTENEKLSTISDEINKFIKIQKNDYDNNINISTMLTAILKHRKVFLFGYLNSYKFDKYSYIYCCLYKLILNEIENEKLNAKIKHNRESKSYIFGENLNNNNYYYNFHNSQKWLNQLDFDKKQAKIIYEIILKQKLEPNSIIKRSKKLDCLVLLNIFDDPTYFLNSIGKDLKNVPTWIRYITRMYQIVHNNKNLLNFIQNNIKDIYRKRIEILLNRIKDTKKILSDPQSKTSKNINDEDLRTEILKSFKGLEGFLLRKCGACFKI